MTEAYAYSETPNAALIGPLHAHREGDVVELPRREHPFVAGYELQGGRFEVVRIEKDGVALARRVVE